MANRCPGMAANLQMLTAASKQTRTALPGRHPPPQSDNTLLHCKQR